MAGRYAMKKLSSGVKSRKYKKVLKKKKKVKLLRKKS
jgi:hypothetical protein